MTPVPVPNDQSLPIVIRPRIAPRDLVDLLLSITVGHLQPAVLLGLSTVTVFYFSGSLFYALAGYFIMISLVNLFAVSSLTVCAEGLRFKRLLGSPKFLPWERISSIAVASRREFVLHGWLWPLFPQRGVTSSYSTLRQYRVTWDSGYCYYPPATPEEFESLIGPRVGKANPSAGAEPCGLPAKP